MSIRATTPYTSYLDVDGKPLTGGYVYFGVAGSNPETTPQAIYWDEALTIPAAQPVRTINGFLMYNGSPGSIYTAAAYSVTVKNGNGALVHVALTNPGAPESVAMAPVVSAATLADGLTAFGFSAYIQTLINDADAATARATLVVPSTTEAVLVTGDQSIAGAKTFSGSIIDKNGNEVLAMQTETKSYFGAVAKADPAGGVLTTVTVTGFSWTPTAVLEVVAATVYGTAGTNASWLDGITGADIESVQYHRASWAADVSASAANEAVIADVAISGATVVVKLLVDRQAAASSYPYTQYKVWVTAAKAS